jgi:hypothetical protein
MLLIDDGLVNGKLDFADLCFLIAAILAVIAAILAVPRNPPRSAWYPVVGFIAIAVLAVGFLVL